VAQTASNSAMNPTAGDEARRSSCVRVPPAVRYGER
jgi:hypothetical protein